MHAKFRVSSARPVCDHLQNFMTSFSTVAVALWARRWSSGHRMVQAEGSSPGGDIYQFLFSAMIFISVLLGIINFNDIVI